MKVLKFGGSSVGSSAMIMRVVDIVLLAAKTTDILVVVSAFQGVTNELIAISSLAKQRSKDYETRLKLLEQKHLDVVTELIPPLERARVTSQVKSWFNDLHDLLEGVWLLRERSIRSQDAISSFGERLSATIISHALNSVIEAKCIDKLESIYLDSRSLVITDANYGAAKLLKEESYEAISARAAQYYPGLDINPALDKNLSGATQGDATKPGQIIPIVTGFIGSTLSGETTTLGRGGSDLTASIFAAALNAESLEIWTDVDGVLTADPRKVKKAFPLDRLTYDEALELCHFGAKVIYAPTMQPVLEKGIAMVIKNTFNPKVPGTIISRESSRRDFPITGTTSIDRISLLRVQGSGMIGVAGVAKRIFEALASAQVNVILITQASSEHTICFAVEPNATVLACESVEAAFALEMQAGLLEPIVVNSDLSIVSIVGENMCQTPGISAKLFGALGRNGINVTAIAQGSSEMNISVVIDAAQEIKALNAVHDEFFLTRNRTLNIFLIGTGLIGGTLLKQLGAHRNTLLTEHHIDVQVLGISNSRSMTIAPEGLSLANYNVLSENPNSAANLQDFMRRIKALNVPNCVMVDCTASAETSSLYVEMLNSHIAVVTPNKRAQSGSMQGYLELKAASQKTGAPFLFETSVGAGLPIISTLNDLLRSGDRIKTIEAVLSGTLSFIFNSFCSKDSQIPGYSGGGPARLRFSQIVNEAKARGFTEPDPREDLSGKDVARKLLILARESGYDLELEAIATENLTPSNCRETSSIDEFLELLPTHDHEMEQLRSEAANRGEKLCYIARLHEGKGSVGLASIGPDHPFYSLSGSDNIVSFTSERYADRPLVVKGPGAGAEVTAAGVFADIIRLATMSPR